MSELQILGANAAVLALAYFFVYPRFGGDDVKRIGWLDLTIGLTTLGILAPFNWGSEDEFTLLPNWDVPWWIFAIVTYAVLEIPLFAIYFTRRGLWASYMDGVKEGFSSETWTTGASTKAVRKQLVDTKWDWIRKPRFMRNLVIAANLWMLFATIFLAQVGDNVWASLSILHMAVLFIFWFLLRTSVRLISEAGDEALDERMITERNQTYFKAYRTFTMIAAGLLTGFMIYVVTRDSTPGSDGFNYQFSLTWPQTQALFWFIWGYAFMLPSMLMAWKESRNSR
jgi:hypothetical protein